MPRFLLSVALVLLHVSPAITQEVATFIARKGWVGGVSFSPDGGTLAACTSAGAVYFWDVSRRELHRTWRAHDNVISSLTFSSDGKAIAWGGQDHLAVIQDTGLETMLRHVLRGHKGAVLSVAFSPDGNRYLATGSIDGSIRLWDPASGKERGVLLGHKSWVNGVGFDPSGNLLCSAG